MTNPFVQYSAKRPNFTPGWKTRDYIKCRGSITPLTSYDSTLSHRIQNAILLLENGWHLEVVSAYFMRNQRKRFSCRSSTSRVGGCTVNRSEVRFGRGGCAQYLPPETIHNQWPIYIKFAWSYFILPTNWKAIAWHVLCLMLVWCCPGTGCKC